MNPEAVDWDALIAEVLERGKEVPEVKWCSPGEDAAMEVRYSGTETPVLHCTVLPCIVSCVSAALRATDLKLASLRKL